jgi:hypothetical protein
LLSCGVCGVPTERRARVVGTQSDALGWYPVSRWDTGRELMAAGTQSRWIGGAGWVVLCCGVFWDHECHEWARVVFEWEGCGVPMGHVAGVNGGGDACALRGVLCYGVVDRGCRECFAGPPGTSGSFLGDGVGVRGLDHECHEWARIVLEWEGCGEGWGRIRGAGEVDFGVWGCDPVWE